MTARPAMLVAPSSAASGRLAAPVESQPLALYLLALQAFTQKRWPSFTTRMGF